MLAGALTWAGDQHAAWALELRGEPSVLPLRPCLVNPQTLPFQKILPCQIQLGSEIGTVKQVEAKH